MFPVIMQPMVSVMLKMLVTESGTISLSYAQGRYFVFAKARTYWDLLLCAHNDGVVPAHGDRCQAVLLDRVECVF